MNPERARLTLDRRFAALPLADALDTLGANVETSPDALTSDYMRSGRLWENR